MTKRFPRALLVIALGALLLRIALGLAFNLEEDGSLRGLAFYRMMAIHALDGEGFHFQLYFGQGPTWANRPPLYAAFLAGIIRVFGDGGLPILLVQSVVGALCVLAVGVLGVRLGGRRVGILAALGWAVYPYAAVNDTSLVEQPLFILFALLATLGILHAHRAQAAGGWALVGSAAVTAVFAGLAALTRETINPLLGLLVPWIVLFWRSAPLRRRFAWCVLLTVGFVAVCSPWLVRNHQRFGKPAFAFVTGKGLWVGNNEHTFSYYPDRSIDRSERQAWEHLTPELRAELRSLDERRRDAVYMRLAREYIEAHPREFVERGLRKVAASFSPVLVPRPRVPGEGLVYTISYGSTLVLGVLGLLLLGRRWRPFTGIVLLAFVSVAVVSFLFWGQTRLRATFDPFLVLFAAGFLDLVLGDRHTEASGGGEEPTPG
jgi:4-amino-4-deoxy-L-arabinose transferase-like glycosyltransferase